MTPTRLDALLLLAAHECAFGRSTRLDELTTETGASYQTWTYRLNRLVHLRLVEVVHCPRSSNVRQFRLTAAGWQLLADLGVELPAKAA